MPTAPIRIKHLSLVSSVEDAIAIELPPIDELARVWPIIEPILKRATDRSLGYQPIDLLQLVMLGRMHLFVVREGGRIVAALVTEVRQYPRRRVLEVPFGGGTGLKRWIGPLMDALDAHAEMLGCQDIIGWDRVGWARFGFEAKGHILVRRLKD